MSGRHITPAGAAVIADALQRASADMADAVVPIPTSVQAFFAVHGADLQALLTSLSYITTPGDTPSAYDVLQIAHRTGAAGELDDAARLRRLADHMITQAAPPSPVWMGVDYAEGVTIDAAQSLKALGDYFTYLQARYAATVTGARIEHNCGGVAQWLNAVSSHHATLEVGRIKPFPMHGMALGGEVG